MPMKEAERQERIATIVSREQNLRALLAKILILYATCYRIATQILEVRKRQ